MKKVLLLSCSTGEGHNSAAKAVAERFSAEGAECVIEDPLNFKSGKSAKKAETIYNNLIRRAPKIFGLAYRLGKKYDDMRLPSPIYAANAKCAEKLFGFISENGFDCVICTHLFAMEAMTAVKRKYPLQIPCFGVLTDYVAVPFYKDTDLDGYFAPDVKTARELIKKGIAADKIYCYGIPVGAKFSSEITKREARAALSLPQDEKLIAVMTGGAGCGKIVSLCKAFRKSLGNKVALYVFTGKNEKLGNRIRKKFGEGNIKTVPFTKDIHLWLKAADVVLSKPGGLSSTEIAVSGVPLVHLKAIPGCETYNLRKFVAGGLSLAGQSVKTAMRQTERLLDDELLCADMVAAQRQKINASALTNVVKKIEEITACFGL